MDCSKLGPISFFGFLDLSALGAGDKVEVRLKMSLATRGKPLLNRMRSFTGHQEEPIVDFPRKEAVNPIITLKQATGESREIKYYWRWDKA